MKSVEKIIKKLTKLNEDGKITDEQKTILLELLNNDDVEEEKEIEVEVEKEETEAEEEPKEETEVEVEEKEKDDETEVETESEIKVEEEPSFEEPKEVETEIEEESVIEYASRKDFDELIKTLDAQTKRIEILEDVVKNLGVEKDKAIGLPGDLTKEPINKISRASLINSRRIGKLY